MDERVRKRAQSKTAPRVYSIKTHRFIDQPAGYRHMRGRALLRGAVCKKGAVRSPGQMTAFDVLIGRAVLHEARRDHGAAQVGRHSKLARPFERFLCLAWRKSRLMP